MTAFNMGDGPDKNCSNAKDDRKMRKPLIEKKRRERINCSLEQLKGIMVDAYNLDQSKLEKADVLEITVQHMDGLQKGHGTGTPSLDNIAGFESRQRYGSGYIQCMHEVHNLLLSCPGMDKTLGARLLNHLLKSLPHVSSDDPGDPDSPSHAGGSRNSGSLNGNGVGGFGGNVVDNGGGGGGNSHSGSPLSGPASNSSSPPGSPLSPPRRAPFRPRRLLLHTPSSSASAQTSSVPCPLSPPAPLTPKMSPSEREANRRPGDGSGLRERPSASFSSSLLHGSPPSSPVAWPGTVALPAAFPSGGDPSMWRPW